MSKIEYICKNCGWKTEIRAEWGDLRPKRCLDKKCKTSFAANPESLLIIRPEVVPPEQPKESSKEKKDGKNKHK